MNDVKSDNLELNSIILNYQFAAIYHIALKMLNRYFGQVMQKKKIWH